MELKQFALAASALVATLASTSCTVDRFQQDGSGGYQRTTYGVTPSDATNLAMVAAGVFLGNQYLNNRDRANARHYNSYRRSGCGNSGGLGGGSRPSYSGNYGSAHDTWYKCSQGGEYRQNGGGHGLGGHNGNTGLGLSGGR